jgi:hypothetical protein
MKKILFLLAVTSTVLFSCTDHYVSPPSNYNNYSGNSGRGGGGNGNNNNALSMGGTNWKLTQYRDQSMTNPITRTDTLMFTDDSHMTWNHVACNYSLTNDGQNMHLTFWGSVFGDITGMPSSNFQSFGQIVDVPFYQLNNHSQVYYLWLQKY